MKAANTETTLTFLGFTSEESHTIVKIGETRSYPEDTIVVQNSHATDSLYIILEGRVNALAVDSEGQETRLADYGIGEYFGGVDFDDTPYVTSIKTVEPSHLLLLRLSDLKAFLPKASKFTKQIFENILSGVEKQAHELAETIQQKRAITDILRSISSSPSNLSSLLETVAENAARLCNAKDVGIFQVVGDELEMVAKFGSTQLWPAVSALSLST